MTCSSHKRRYQTRKEAKHAKRPHRDTGHNISSLRAYRCDECGFWHVGHLSAMVIGGWQARADRYPQWSEVA